MLLILEALLGVVITLKVITFIFMHLADALSKATY